MRVYPVGSGPSGLGVYWPLWDAALLRRYGRTPGVCYAIQSTCRTDAPGQGIKSSSGAPFHSAQDEATHIRIHNSPAGADGPHRCPLIVEPVAHPTPLPDLELPWPSRDVPPIVIQVVIERTAPDIVVAGQYFDILL